MATPNAGVPQQQGDTAVERRGGYAIGDVVRVSNRNSTYHGDEGNVVAFTKNGAHRSLWVELNGVGKKCLAVKSLSSVPNRATAPVQRGTGATGNSVGVAAVAMEEQTVTSTISGSARTPSNSSTMSRERFREGFGTRLLRIHDFVEDIRDNDKYEEDEELKAQLREIQSMILGLNIGP